MQSAKAKDGKAIRRAPHQKGSAKARMVPKEEERARSLAKEKVASKGQSKSRGKGYGKGG